MRKTVRWHEGTWQRWRKWVLPMIPVVAGLIAYSDSFSGAMVFDDFASLRDNPAIRTLIPDQGPQGKGTTLSGRPILRLTFWLDYTIAGMRLGLYHATNLAIHLGAALILYGIIRRTPGLAQTANQREWLATIAATLWTVHPLNTEAVTYIVQRAESLASFFYLLVIYGLIRVADDERHAAIWSLFAIAACALGMGTKEIVVTAPVVALLYDRTFLAGSFAAVLRLRWRLYTGLAATWIVLAILLSSQPRGPTVGFSYDITAMEYARTQLGMVAHYLRLAFWPVGIVFDEYSWPVVRHISEIPWSGWLTVILGLATLVALWRWPRVGFAGAWFFIILSPSSSFVPIVTEIGADHRMYLPLIAVIVPAVMVADALRRRLRIEHPGALAAIPIVALTIATWNRNLDYHSAETLWARDIELRPENPRAHYNLGVELKVAQKLPESNEQFRQVFMLKLAAKAELQAEAREHPDDPRFVYDMGMVCVDVQDWAGAVDAFQRTERIAPDFRNVREELAQARQHMIGR